MSKPAGSSTNRPTARTAAAWRDRTILMFGDWDWIAQRAERQQAAFRDWSRAHAAQSVVIEIGAGCALKMNGTQAMQGIAQALAERGWQPPSTLP